MELKNGPNRISVILPVYNADRFLVNAIDSILAQSFRDFEIIAVDDGSTDQSAAILSEFAVRDPRVKVISRGNTGIVGALEAGRAIAKGEYLARMDADDWAAPERFARQLEAMKSDSSLVALGSSVTFMDVAGNTVESCDRVTEPSSIRAGLLAGDGGTLIHPSVMFRTKAVAIVGGYRESAQYVEDLDLYLRLEMIGNLRNLPEQLLKYRVHPTSINFTKSDGREEVRLRVLRNAYAARGLNFDPISFLKNRSDFADLHCLYRRWAVTALAHGSRRVAIRHGWRAVRRTPCDPAAWKAFRYALTAPRANSSFRACHEFPQK